MPEIYPGVSVDPDICFGRPRLTAYGITTWIIGLRFTAGESVRQLMSDYNMARLDVEAALRFEMLSRYRRRKLTAQD